MDGGDQAAAGIDQVRLLQQRAADQIHDVVTLGLSHFGHTA